ncbi:MAG: LysR family transcriptional regulator [Anaerotardibacter sp.]
MNLSQLTYFKKLAEVKHYTKAASELYITQPALSIAISSLEKELGAQLFYRSKNQIELTDCGKDFYYYITLALQNIERGKDAVKEHVGKTNAKLNLGTLYAMQGKEWSQAVADFNEEYGNNLQIKITQGFTADLTKLLEEDALDVIFASRTREQKNLIYRHIWSQELAVAVHKTNPLSSKEMLTLDDLKGFHVFAYAPGNPAYDETLNVVKDAHLDIEFGYSDEITISSLVTSNPESIGLLCYSFLVKAFDEVVFLPLKEAPENFHKVYMIQKRNAAQSEVTKNFINFMSHYYFPVAKA